MAYEAIHAIERQVIFREGFQSAFQCRRNGGKPTDVSFENGKAVNTTGYIDYPSLTLPSAWSIRVKFKATSLATDNSLFGSIYVLPNTTRLYVNSSGGGLTLVNEANSAVNTASAAIVVDTDYEVIITNDGSGANNIQFYRNGDAFEVAKTLTGVFVFRQLLAIGDNTLPLVGNMDLFEIRNKCLTAEEVKNLYENKRFRELHSPDEILSVSASGGTINDRWNNTIVNTAVDVFKIGSIRVGEYDGSTSLLNIDSIVSTLSATETGTFMSWIKTNDASITQEIISFGDTDADTRIQWDITGAGLLRALVGESGVTKWALDTDAIAVKNNTWVHVALVQDGTSPVLYVNGEAVAQTFSTSTDKTYWFSDMTGLDNGRIGCGSWNSGGNATFYGGLIEDSRIINGILTAQKINQAYTESKHLYGL